MVKLHDALAEIKDAKRRYDRSHKDVIDFITLSDEEYLIQYHLPYVDHEGILYINIMLGMWTKVDTKDDDAMSEARSLYLKDDDSSSTDCLRTRMLRAILSSYPPPNSELRAEMNELIESMCCIPSRVRYVIHILTYSHDA